MNSKKIIFYLIIIFSVVLSLFHLFTSYKGVLEPLLQRPIHLALIMGLVFIYRPWKKGGNVGWGGILLSLLGVVSVGYVAIFYEDIIQKSVTLTSTDMIFGIITILLLFEATRRTNGWPLIILASIFLVYAYLGPYMPSSIMHAGYDMEEIVYYMFISTEGIFGLPLGVAATYIYLFILFGAILEKTGMGEFFNDLAMALLGKYAGGPAKVSVVGSAMMGTINGSAIANVVTTGAFTIPLMKKIGYRGSFAGAVESVASLGGYFLPPVMASTAFIMSEMLGRPYSEIVIAAIIPAILYFLAIILNVHLRAKKDNLKGLPKSELPRVGEVLKKRGFLMLPVLLLVAMLFFGFTPIFAAFVSIVSAIVVSSFSKATRMKPIDFIDASRMAGKNTVSVTIACAIVGMIMGVATLTGIGLRASSVLIEIGAGNLFLTLLLTMLASIILGMGLPSIPTYILTATMAAPALTELGVLPIAAHFFVFYFGSLANVTPPVALAAFAAAGISGSNATKTGFVAMKLAAAGFIIPFVFVYSPILLLQDATAGGVVLVTVTSILGVIMLAIGLEGYGLVKINILERVLSLVASICLITTQWYTDVIGIVLILILLLAQYKRFKESKDNTDTVTA